jgi:hypothetical protein
VHRALTWLRFLGISKVSAILNNNVAQKHRTFSHKSMFGVPRDEAQSQAKAIMGLNISRLIGQMAKNAHRKFG